MELNGVLALLEANQLRSSVVQWFNVRDFGAEGNSTNDRYEIQTALYKAKDYTNNTVDGYSVVYVPKGTYLLDNPLRIPSNCLLLCDRNAKFERMNDTMNAMLINDSDGTSGGYNANKNISIVGGIWDGRKDLYTTPITIMGFGHLENLLVQGVNFKNIPDWHMIELNGVKNGIVEKCIFENYGDNGNSKVGSEILQIDMMYSSGTFPWFGPYDSTVCQNILVKDNVFQNGTDGVGTHTVKQWVSHQDIKVVNNRFYNMAGVGVKGINWKDILVDGNQFESCDVGVKLGADVNTNNKNVRIVNNGFLSCNKTTESRGIWIYGPDDGAYVGHGVIANNTMEVIGRHGICIDHSFNWVVNGNVITNCQQAGIYVRGGSNANINSNTVRLNNKSNTASIFDIMIANDGTDKMEDSTVQGNVCNTIYVSEGTNVLVANNYAKISITQGTNNVAVTIKNNLVASTYA